MAWIGDGATSTGAFHEGLNFAAVQKLPLGGRRRRQQIRLLDPIAKQMAITAHRRARGGVRDSARDGGRQRHPGGLRRREAAGRPCARGDGAALIGVDTMRMQGHAQHDDARYVPKAMLRVATRIRSCASAPRLIETPPATGARRDRHDEQATPPRKRRRTGCADARPASVAARRLRRRRFRDADGWSS